MATKAVNPEAVALEALAQALVDPTPKVLFGSAKSPGFFKGATQAVKAAAQLCEERQWLAGTGAWLGKGASKKQTYRLTPAGLQAVLGQSETLVLLRSVHAALQEQTQLCHALRDRLGQLQPLSQVVEQLAQRIQPPDLSKVLAALQSPGPAVHEAAPPSARLAWLDEVVQLAAEQKQRDRYNPLTLPQAYRALQGKHPGLTLGEYHEGLRTLRDQGRIRLGPYTRALATIEDPRNALFLDGEVMYYVELP